MSDASAGALPDGAVDAHQARRLLVADAEKLAVLEPAAPAEDGWQSAGQVAGGQVQALYRPDAVRFVGRSFAVPEPEGAEDESERLALQLGSLEPVARC